MSTRPHTYEATHLGKQWVESILSTPLPAKFDADAVQR